jgi:hypothetical protein
VDRLHIELDLRMQHQHADGTWGTLKPIEPHSPAELDSEREWANGRLYRCTSCDELVRVAPVDEEPPPD